MNFKTIGNVDGNLQVKKAQTSNVIFDQKPISFDDIVKRHGFTSYSVLDLSNTQNGRIDPQLQATNLNATMMGVIDEAGGLGESKLFDCISASNVPVGWKFATDAALEEDFPISPVDHKLAELFGALGLCSGYSIPVYSLQSRRSLVTYFADHSGDFEHFPELILETIECFEKAFSEGSIEEFPNSTLNRSERNCVLWAAQGKTSSEIGTILSLSEHTVNHYFSVAAAKLGATNRTHLVAKAIQQQIINVHEF